MTCTCAKLEHRIPKKRWNPLGDGSFRLSQNDSVWLLIPTPNAKYPWLLRRNDGAEQEIGAKGTRSAKAMAEFDIEISRYIGRGTGAAKI
ncbi:hypothetical protein [Amycolatopsis sp. NPDC051128]|uniref:hypothetical protein n=1 Tax=Amycolatopsis sp. NPDC051128 TaxID=3155412 RepID=UPI0034198440